MPEKVFISYRRDDTAADAHRIADKLRKVGGPDSVFLDAESVEPGTEWSAHIRSALEQSRYVIAVIGPDWLTAGIDEWGRRRIDSEDDWVRQELASALSDTRKTVIPVLVGGAQLPPGDALPDDIAGLSLLQAIDVRPGHWSHDIKQLTATLRGEPDPGLSTTPGADAQRLDLELPFVIRRIRKQEKIDAEVIANVAFHPDGHMMAYSRDDRLFLLPLTDHPEFLGQHPERKGGSPGDTSTPSSQPDTAATSHALVHQKKITDIAFSPRGDLLASSDIYGNIKLWSLDTRECLVELDEHDDIVSSICFSPRADQFATAGFDEYIHIWDLDVVLSGGRAPSTTFEKRSQIKIPPKHPHDIEQIVSMTYSHNGKHIASGDQQGVVVIREIASQEEHFRKKVHNDHVTAIAFSPTDPALLATASIDSRIRLSDTFGVSGPQTLGVGPDKHQASVMSLAFSYKGDILVSCGDDRQVKLWDVQKRLLLHNHTTDGGKQVDKVVFLPNRYDFATDSYRSDISLWDITNEGEVTNTRVDFQ